MQDLTQNSHDSSLHPSNRSWKMPKWAERFVNVAVQSALVIGAVFSVGGVVAPDAVQQLVSPDGNATTSHVQPEAGKTAKSLEVVSAKPEQTIAAQLKAEDQKHTQEIIERLNRGEQRMKRDLAALENNTPVAQNVAYLSADDVKIAPRCLVPKSYGICYTKIMEVNLWEVYCILMPRQRLKSEKKYKTLKRVSCS